MGSSFRWLSKPLTLDIHLTYACHWSHGQLTDYGWIYHCKFITNRKITHKHIQFAMSKQYHFSVRTKDIKLNFWCFYHMLLISKSSSLISDSAQILHPCHYCCGPLVVNTSLALLLVRAELGGIKSKLHVLSSS